MKPTLACLILTLTLIPPPVAADTSDLQGIPEPWRSGFKRIESDLDAGRWQDGAHNAGQLAERMARLFPASPTGRVMVGSALAMQAIAEVEAGRRDEALWHWQVAQNLNPELQRAPFAEAFGETGAWLEVHRLRSPGSLKVPAAAATTPPAPLSVPVPKPPAELRQAWRSKPLEVEVVIDSSGQVRSPVVLDGGELPGKVYFGLAALKRWRFRPALAGGEPTAALMRLDRLVPTAFAFATARSRTLGPVHGLLLEEHWEEARSAAQRLVGKNLDCPVSHARICDPGLPLLLRAVAEAGLGRTEDALWSWHLAASFLPLPAAGTLAIYGPGPRRLFAEQPCAVAPEVCGAVALGRASGITSPKAMSTPALRLPPKLAGQVGADRFVASLVVDASGRVAGAVMRTGHSAAAGYLALMSLRDWRFEPARRGGEPVAVVYETSIPLVPAAPAEQVTRWQQGMDALRERLAAGDSQGARDEAAARSAEIAAGVGDGGSDLLARSVAQLALAEAGLGLADAAVWHWHTAQNLAVEYRASDLSAYGEAGEMLDRHRLRQPGEGLGNSAGRDPAPTPRIAGSMPQFPQGTAATAEMTCPWG